MFKSILSLFKTDDLKKVKKFLFNAKNISIGFSEINFIEVNNFEKCQIGYRIDQNGNNLCDLSEDGWNQKWYVIATDHLGDPIFVDTSDYYLPVYTAVHGNGDWEPMLLSISLEAFDNIIKKIQKLALNRENPVLFETNPITETQYTRIIKSIKKNNPDVDIEWWESFLYKDLDEN